MLNFFTLLLVSVEDPTDGCQAIRDFIDLCRCENLPCFSNENLKKGYKKEIENELREKFQIHKVRELILNNK